jgi:hypothetical protein
LNYVKNYNQRCAREENSKTPITSDRKYELSKLQTFFGSNKTNKKNDIFIHSKVTFNVVNNVFLQLLVVICTLIQLIRLEIRIAFINILVVVHYS